MGAYKKRYAVDESTAYEELISLGHQETILIQSYEQEGTRWEYRVEPLSGEMVIVPEGTEEHEIYELYPDIYRS